MFEDYAKRRDELGLTDYIVCQQLGIATSSMSQWRTGKRPLSNKHLLKISMFLGIPMEKLANEDGEQVVVPSLAEVLENKGLMNKTVQQRLTMFHSTMGVGSQGSDMILSESLSEDARTLATRYDDCSDMRLKRIARVCFDMDES